MDGTKRAYIARKTAFPKAGTAQYKALQDQTMKYLVQQSELEQKAKGLGITVTDKDVQARIAQIKKQYFGGSQTKYLAQLKAQGLTEALLALNLQGQILSERIYAKVTGNTKVTDADIAKYYAAHKSTYAKAASRDVRHILVNSKTLADSIEAQLKAGASFAVLAKKYSKDPGSAAQGGKLTISKGQTVAPFDKVAFALKLNELSAPVHTTYGWHVIQALSAGQAGDAAAVEGRQDGDLDAAPADEEDRRDQQVGRRREQGVREEDRVPDRLHAAQHGNHDDCRDHDLATSVEGLEQALLDLQRLTEQLRRECPWDRDQTARTIVPHTVEEAYEVADAALAGDDAKLLDELGDLLFQVYFLALLLSEKGEGDLADVARGIHEKLVRRHPHVFGEVQADTAGRVKENWDRIKVEQEGREGVFHDVPATLPGLLYARKVQQRAKSVGFEYPDVAGAVADLDDELRELKDDLDSPERRAEELGDVLFAAVNVARKLEVDPELELRRAADRFRARVETAEKLAASNGENWSELPLEQQDRYFDRAKETTE